MPAATPASSLRLTPASPEGFAAHLAEAALHSRSLTVFGNNSKRLMAGPLLPADTVLSTARLNRLLLYEPNDLTVSVEAGMPWADLAHLLKQHRQMIALDPPFSPQATVGGVVATNGSGPLRRAFGTARDLVIGMRFATLAGKLVQAGGMVVKNVAGLDMGKLLIGSFGTLAALTSVNFRLHAIPEEMATFLFSFPDLDAALEKRNALLRGVLRPLALDLLSPPASARLGGRGYILAVRAGGSRKVLLRYADELKPAEQLSGDADKNWWLPVREFAAEFLRRQPDGIVLRVSTPLGEIGDLLRLTSDASIARAGSGVSYLFLRSAQGLSSLWNTAAARGWNAVVEFAPDDLRASKDLWLSTAPRSADTFAMMKRVKHMFDPQNLLNRSRLYGRL